MEIEVLPQTQAESREAVSVQQEHGYARLQGILLSQICLPESSIHRLHNILPFVNKTFVKNFRICNSIGYTWPHHKVHHNK